MDKITKEFKGSIQIRILEFTTDKNIVVFSLEEGCIGRKDLLESLERIKDQTRTFIIDKIINGFINKEDKGNGD